MKALQWTGQNVAQMTRFLKGQLAFRNGLLRISLPNVSHTYSVELGEFIIVDRFNKIVGCISPKEIYSAFEYVPGNAEWMNLTLKFNEAVETNVVINLPKSFKIKRLKEAINAIRP